MRQQPVNSMVFLRGGQMTDDLGQVSFQTIYPGWYRGRTVHIHFKIRTTPQAASGYTLTSQLYFDDSLSDRIYEQPPYSQKTGRDTRNSDDGIYADGGSQLTLPLTSTIGGGYTAAFAIGLRFA
jgi:protocatechuate 3,4-dioxygenase beta subunit